LVGIALAPIIIGWTNAPDGQQSALTLAVIIASIGAGLSVVTYSLGAIPQAWQRTTMMGITILVGNIASVSAVLLGLFSNLGVISLSLRNISNFLVYLVGFSLYIFCFWKRLGFPLPSLDIQLIYVLCKDSSMLLLSKISNAISSNLEAPVAAMAITPEASAILVLTGRAVTVIQEFADRVSSAVFAGVSYLSQDPNFEIRRGQCKKL